MVDSAKKYTHGHNCVRGIGGLATIASGGLGIRGTWEWALFWSCDILMLV